MPNRESKPLPQRELSDHAHTATKAILSAIPIVGGPVAELFNAVIATPFTKRRDEWLQSLATGLNELKANVRQLSDERLSANEVFITIFMHATQVAIRNHQKEKLDALRNAVLNAALPDCIQEELQAYFITLIDDLTPLHIRILKFVNDSIAVLKKVAASHPDEIARSRQGMDLIPAELVFPDYEPNQDLYDQACDDLMRRGLANSNDLGIVSEKTPGSTSHKHYFHDSLRKTTKLGVAFLKYLESPLGK